MIFDAIIIGGGPAGCAAGISLAKDGWKTAILEKSAFPRHKVCGEFFSPGSVTLWKKLGVLEKILKAGAIPLTKTSLHFPGQKEINLSLKYTESPAYSLSRFTFDKLMLHHARESGCRIFYEAEALNVKESEDYCLVQIKSGIRAEELKTRFTVIATGRNHRFQKKSGPTPKGKIGFKRHFKSENWPDGPDGLELYFFPGGYLGLVKIENEEMNLSGILDQKQFKKFGANFNVLLAQVLKNYPLLGSRLEKVTPSTPWLSCVTARGFKGRNSPRLLWAGDAAYFLEPMIGQGMTMAMACGILAAEALVGKKDPARFFDAQSKKFLNSKRSLLNFLEPLGGISAKIPKISGVAAQLILKPKIMEKILSEPS